MKNPAAAKKAMQAKREAEAKKAAKKTAKKTEKKEPVIKLPFGKKKTEE